MIDINSKIDDSRKELSYYCINSCKAKCCRKGHLLVNLKTLKAIYHEKECKVEVRPEGNYDIDLNLGCPGLEGDKCGVYANKERPVICYEFPIFIRGKSIFISSFCPEGKRLYSEYLECEKEGFGFKVVLQ